MGPSVCPEPGHELREKGHGEEGDPVMGGRGAGRGLVLGERAVLLYPA